MLLEKQSFMFVERLQSALFVLREYTQSISEVQLIACERGRCYALDEFVSAQRVAQDRMMVTLAAFSNDVRALALAACEHLVDAFLTANGVVADVKMTFRVK